MLRNLDRLALARTEDYKNSAEQRALEEGQELDRLREDIQSLLNKYNDLQDRVQALEGSNG